MYEFTIALASNLEQEKNAVFNALTGMNQQTGYWPDTTIAKTKGKYLHGEIIYNITNLPSTCSLTSHSIEKEITRDYICFDNVDATIIICDATCLEVDLNLVLQILLITGNVIVYLTKTEEVKRKNISINCEKLSKLLNIPVIATGKRKKQGLLDLIDTLDIFMFHNNNINPTVIHAPAIEHALLTLSDYLADTFTLPFTPRYIASKLLEHDVSFFHKLETNYNIKLLKDPSLLSILDKLQMDLADKGISNTHCKALIASQIEKQAKEIYRQVAIYLPAKKSRISRKIDKALHAK